MENSKKLNNNAENCQMPAKNVTEENRGNKKIILKS